MELDLRGIAASSGATCTAMTGEPRRVAGDRLDREAAGRLALLLAGRWTRRARSTSCSMPFRRVVTRLAAWPLSRVALFLFDIDGTLVSCAVRPLGVARALKRPTERPERSDRYDFRGRTDLRIVHDLMTDAGVDADRIGRGSTTALRRTCASSRALIAMARGSGPAGWPRSSGGSAREGRRSSGSSPGTSRRARG